ncbi:MAG: AmmeMemoRadiSam system protein A [Persicimonas sp.]
MSTEAAARPRTLLDESQRGKLLDIAEASIAYGLEHGEPLGVELDEAADYLNEQRATFVTVYIDGELDGCIGSIQPRRPLAVDVATNAYMAAFEDPRFSPVGADGLTTLEVRISVLSPLEPRRVDDEDQLCRLLEPGVHGLLLEHRGRLGTLLPSVWEKCPDRREFVAHVKRKAGLPRDFWSDRMRASTYTVEYVCRDH